MQQLPRYVDATREMAVGENPVFYASAQAGALSKGPPSTQSGGRSHNVGCAVRDGSASYFWQPEPWKRGLPKGYHRARAKTGQALSCNVLSRTSSHLFSLPRVPSRNPPDPTRRLTLFSFGPSFASLAQDWLCTLHPSASMAHFITAQQSSMGPRTAGTSNHGTF
jgi:hypothetical protein